MAVIGVLAGQPVAAQRVSYNGSVAYSTGSYVFADRTHSLWMSSGLSVSGGPLSVTASIPVIVQNSGVVSFVAGQPLPTGGEGSGALAGRGSGGKIGTRGPGTGSMSTDSTVVFRDRYEVQVGDPLLSSALEVYSGTGGLRSLSLQASAKPPLRSLESGVGTGEWDFGGGASVVAGSGSTLLFLDGSYWSFGDLPDLELAGSFVYSAAVSRSVMGFRGSVLLGIYGATSIIDTVDPPLSTGAGFLYSFSDSRSVSVNATVGLSEASPDLSVSLGWGVRLH